MESAGEQFYAVDRVEGRTALLVADDGSTLEVALDRLPRKTREGSVLRLSVGPAGPDWETARLDTAERRRRLREAKEVLKRLRSRDPGGDVTL